MGGKILIAGGGGFIGGHLVSRLREAGVEAIRCIDRKPVEEWRQVNGDVENRRLDLRCREACREAVRGMTHVFHLAAGPVGSGRYGERMCDVVIDTHLLEAARDSGTVERFFFASSSSVYGAGGVARLDEGAMRCGCREEEAYPAMPDDGEGWEKLFGERLCRHFSEDFGLETRVARLHGVYGPWGGPLGDAVGSCEEVPGVICRRVAEAVAAGRRDVAIELPGDGGRTRSFTFVDDCTRGMLAVMGGTIPEPVNLGSAEMVSLDRVAALVGEIAGVGVECRYRFDAPAGARSRGSDNTLIRSYLDWEPTTPLRAGLEATFRWAVDAVARGSAPAPRVPRRLPPLLRAAS